MKWSRKRILFTVHYFLTWKIFRRYYLKYLYLRAFRHHNLWLYPEEVQRIRNRKLRMRKKKMYGTTMSLTKRYGWKLVRRDGPYCRGCKKHCDPRSNQFSVDHIIPVSKGGSNDISNMQIMHIDCNNKKGNDDYRKYLSTEPMPNYSFKDAFEKAGITPESTPSLFPVHALQSKTSERRTLSRAATYQSRSRKTPFVRHPSSGTSRPHTQGPSRDL